VGVCDWWSARDVKESKGGAARIVVGGMMDSVFEKDLISRPRCTDNWATKGRCLLRSSDFLVQTTRCLHLFILELGHFACARINDKP
jgi:hypothetical protein